jgi:hypothetical protein
MFGSHKAKLKRRKVAEARQLTDARDAGLAIEGALKAQAAALPEMGTPPLFSLKGKI